MTTVGAFLKEKVTNMINWMIHELGKENLPPNIQQFIEDRSYVELTLFAECLNTHHSLIIHKDWSGLVRVLNEEGVPNDFACALLLVRAHEHMHDKFWRYLELFSNTV